MWHSTFLSFFCVQFRLWKAVCIIALNKNKNLPLYQCKALTYSVQFGLVLKCLPNGSLASLHQPKAFVFSNLLRLFCLYLVSTAHEWYEAIFAVHVLSLGCYSSFPKPLKAKYMYGYMKPFHIYFKSCLPTETTYVSHYHRLGGIQLRKSHPTWWTDILIS